MIKFIHEENFEEFKVFMVRYAKAEIKEETDPSIGGIIESHKAAHASKLKNGEFINDKEWAYFEIHMHLHLDIYILFGLVWVWKKWL